MRITSIAEQQALRAVPDDLANDDLARQLRNSRLTVLYGAATSSAGELIRGGLASRLARRNRDRALMRLGQPDVAPAGQDRRTLAQSQCSAELVVLVDTWHESQIAILQRRIGDALESAGAYMTSMSLPIAYSLSAWSQLLDVRFLIIFDRFEHFLTGCERSDEGRRFTEELARVLHQPGLPANFLVCVSAGHEDAMRQFQAQLAELEDVPCIRLPMRPLTVPAPVTEVTSIEPPAPPQIEPAGRRDESNAPERLSLTSEDAARAWGQPLPATTMPDAGACAASGGLDQARVADRAAVRLGAVVVAAIAAIVALYWQTRTPHDYVDAVGRVASAGKMPDGQTFADRPLIAVATAPPSVQRAVAKRPHLAITVDGDNPSDSQIAQELIRRVALASVLDLELVRGIAPNSNAEGPASLAILNYDQLQAQRQVAPGGSAEVLPRIIAPLFIEEVYFIVRAASPLRFIHEIRNRDINVGAANRARATTASNLYRRMFGVAIPQRPFSDLSPSEALARLLAGRSVDVVVLVGAQPDAWFTSLPAETARSLKLLQLDPDDAADRRVLQSYLPATLHASAGSELPRSDLPTIGVMSFLVTYGPHDDASDRQLEPVARALCTQLPALRRQGHPKWREVQLGLHLDTGWTDWPPTARASAHCDNRLAPEPSSAQRGVSG